MSTTTVADTDDRKRSAEEQARILAHALPFLRRYARAIVECAGTGVCTSDYATLDFRKVRRPIYPLDPI